MLTLKGLGTGKRSLEATIIILLLYIVAFLTKIGLAYKLAFILPFGVFDFLVLAYINKRLVKSYRDSRAIKLFVYGFGSVALLVFILMLFGVGE